MHSGRVKIGASDPSAFSISLRFISVFGLWPLRCVMSVGFGLLVMVRLCFCIKKMLRVMCDLFLAGSWVVIVWLFLSVVGLAILVFESVDHLFLAPSCGLLL